MTGSPIAMPRPQAHWPTTMRGYPATAVDAAMTASPRAMRTRLATQARLFPNRSETFLVMAAPTIAATTMGMSMSAPTSALFPSAVST